MPGEPVPIYLLGKYYLGIQPVKAGYAEFSITPNLGGLKWMEGTVPTPSGEIRLFMDSETIKVTTTEGCGYLTFNSESQPQASKGTIEKQDENKYRLQIEGNGEVVVGYK